MLCFRMAAKNEFSFRENSHVTKIRKTIFPMEFYNEIWLKVGEHKYIYIFQIRFGKKYSVRKWGLKQVLGHCAIVLS